MANQARGTQKTRAVLVLSTISIIYVGAFLVLVGKTMPCEGAISANWFSGFFDRYLGCRGVNELGDALAGAFAPVAFLWLAGAVFIQSRELNETQDVMRAQLAVSQAQVDETKASTSMLKQQTEILVQQHQRRKQEVADHTLEGTIDALRNFLKASAIQVDFREYKAFMPPLKNQGYRLPTWFELRGDEIASLEDHQIDLFGTSGQDHQLADITKILRFAAVDGKNYIQRLETLELTYRRAFTFDGTFVQLAVVQQLIDLLQRMSSQSSALSDAARVRLASTGIDQTIEKLQEFAKVFNDFRLRMNARRQTEFPDSPQE